MHCLNIASNGAYVTCDGRLFQKLVLETGKAHLLMVERLEVVGGSRAESVPGWHVFDTGEV